jgi:GH24 family phage-related lysozyme (muramidase)
MGVRKSRRTMVGGLTAAAAAVVLLAGCGPAHHVMIPTKVSPPVKVVSSIPVSQIRIPLESARTPEDATASFLNTISNQSNGDTLILPAFIASSIHIDAAGSRLIEGFENKYESVYCPFYDPYGRVWTRAFGETDWSGNFGGVCISHAQAEANVKRLVESDYQYAVRGLGINLNQCQVNGLDDFVWNLGAGIFVGPLRYAIQHREWSAILGYDMAGGVVLSGLRTRRIDEYNLLNQACGDSPPKPLTHAQIVAKKRAELSGHEHLLNQLRIRQRVLRRELAAKGCYPRLKENRAGPICRRWKREGNEVSAHGRKEDAFIARLKRELA